MSEDMNIRPLTTDQNRDSRREKIEKVFEGIFADNKKKNKN